MTEIFDALEFCLQEMERGADLDTVLARFPEHADELRPILKTAAKARSMVSAEPSPDVVRRSRAQVMQRAAQLRESKAAPRQRVIPALSRLAISFALTALFLASGAGLVNASASALPGENLYPVKRGWESIRLFFIFDPQLRNMLEDEYENERLHEVNELLAEGRHEVIQFAGVYMQVNGIDYVSGLKVILPADAPALANGDAVIVTGRTNAQGFIRFQVSRSFRRVQSFHWAARLRWKLRKDRNRGRKTLLKANQTPGPGMKRGHPSLKNTNSTALSNPFLRHPL
ncbi:MAG: hypothetical protein IPG44_05805 [Anaerolineales bacterium]|nr:hypothetical protein [Anaerolineales bacterium]